MGSPIDPMYMARVIADKYRVGRLLGQGGMGAVYQAEHTELGTSVAVKMMSDHCIAAPEAIIRFKREARALAAVHHDNVVSVVDAGTDQGQPFLVMELMEGETLDTLLRRQRRLPLHAAVWIATEVLAGLAATHAQGIVHRDLKPGNVFIARQADGSARAKLLDFGASKLVGGDDLSATRDGTAVGTPLFMAPEQIRGERIDGRADLYATGIVLYNMLTGRWPWAITRPEDLYDEILQGDIRPMREAAPEISAALECAVLRALDRDPNKRYANASMMRTALLSCMPQASHGANSIPLMGEAPMTPPLSRAATGTGPQPAQLGAALDDDPHKAFSIIQPANLSMPRPIGRPRLRRAMMFIAGVITVASTTVAVLSYM